MVKFALDRISITFPSISSNKHIRVGEGNRRVQFYAVYRACVMNTLIASARADPLYFLIRYTQQQSHLSAPFRFPTRRVSPSYPPIAARREPFPKLNSTLSRFPPPLFLSISSLPLYIYHINEKKLSAPLHSRNLWSNYFVVRSSLRKMVTN